MIWPPEEIWDDPMQLVEYYETHAISLHPLPGILVLSIIVSVLGSYATLLVLGRRTSSRGWRNHLFLGLAAVCFAAVAVWGMHFVSYVGVRGRASPDLTWYIEFSRGMTAVSLFVPLISTAMAFWFIGYELDIPWWRIVVSGVFVGLTIVFMHYSAAFRLPFLRVGYSVVTVVFAIVLACVAATAALFLFFRLRSQWSVSWWKRGLCSIFLAVAVCGMHYLGLGGTSYFTKPGVMPDQLAGGGGQSTRLIIAISVMCAMIVVISITFALIDLLARREIRKKARHIVVASAAFAEDGKILVRHDGTIPMQMIETEADLGGVMSELDPRQSTFQWLYQLTFNWSLVRPFVPRVFESTERRTKSKQSRESAEFRQRFVEASVLLARQLGTSVESLGELFDRVMTTGTRIPVPDAAATSDDSSSIHGITLKLHASEGVLLFLVREIGKGLPLAVDYPKMNQDTPGNFDTVDWWLERGYRLTETRFFSRTLADHMGVGKGEMDVFLSACKTYAKRGSKPVVQSGGTYLGLFGVRPTDSTLDVLVYNFARHQIPAYRLPDVQYPLTASMRAWIRECSNATMSEILERANESLARADSSDQGSIQSREDEELLEFQAAIVVAMESLTSALKSWPTIQDLARLSPEVLELPSSNFDDDPPAQMVVLEVILPAPEARLTPIQSRASGIQAPVLSSGRADSDKPPPPFIYTPWTLFAKSQNMIIRGKKWNEICKSLNTELIKSYPLIPTDLAAEIDAEEKAIQDIPSLPRVSRLGRRPGTGTSPATPAPLASPDSLGFSDIDTIAEEKAALQESAVRRPGTGEKESAKRGLFVGRKDVTGDERRGPPIYRSVRQKTDGWYLRSMRTLERGEQGSWLNGNDWQAGV
ncbi:hypothetical protein BD324DRAFT_649847 [Kockovaella imperatae]|uniref:MHYT domain-containing protein n=1 Tax=Kockovaella imperatae TaxID=4999 RepID=A0A1Y1UK91_9TREE|nr:hypothetical protein BD324DRAFT_649847 [Kockovaella imperatae]ORX38480.1 hypothetical protein BD324DRAFT_649847 [Kockovaella imperatae]